LLAAATAFFVALVFGRWFVSALLARRVLEQADKGDSARLTEMHRSKKSTPTMGGFIYLLALLVATVLWARPDNRLVWIVLLASGVLAVIGFLDDYIKLTVKGRKGVSARLKLTVQLLLGFGLGAYFYYQPLHVDPDVAFGLFLPVGQLSLIPLGLGFIPLCALVVAGSSNGVNLTDGLDGLAMGCAVLVALPLAVVAYLTGDAEASARIGLPHIPEAGELSVLAAALVGAGLGFLWFNCHPAQIFMGDTGALPLGGSLGLLAVMLRQEVFFVIVGGVFVLETLSVILQVGSFKLRGKRIFLIAPLHHHFQFKGWTETKVTVRFWIVSAALATISLLLLTPGQ
jgi:phospho-N-acetylmuramoyl-pentapeptide-transferase